MYWVIGEPSALRDSILTKIARSSDLRYELLDSNGDDMEVWDIGAKIGVAFIRANDDRAGFRNQEIGAGHAGVGVQDQRTGRIALGARKVGRVIIVRIGTDGRGEYFGHVGA